MFAAWQFEPEHLDFSGMLNDVDFLFALMSTTFTNVKEEERISDLQRQC